MARYVKLTLRERSNINTQVLTHCVSRYMDPLGDLSSVSGSDSEAEDVTRKPAKSRKLCLDPDPEALEAAGFKSGPSVLRVPEPTGEANWDW